MQALVGLQRKGLEPHRRVEKVAQDEPRGLRLRVEKEGRVASSSSVFAKAGSRSARSTIVCLKS